jgi:polyribonucleotide nucleotidyltransferase
VAGNINGMAALQMDIKIQRITKDIMQVALVQAKEGRQHILAEMQKAMQTVKTELRDFVSRLMVIKINLGTIHDVLGEGGASIRVLTVAPSTQSDIIDERIVTIASVDTAAGQEAKRRINELTASVEVGKTYDGIMLKTVGLRRHRACDAGQDSLCTSRGSATSV